MPVEIFLSRANAEPEYDTIDEADVLDTDTVVEHITEEPKEGEEGEPKQKAKIVRRPVSISDIHPLWTKIRVSVRRKNILSSTARYLWTTKNHYSGST